MARGKHAAAASKRRETADVERDLVEAQRLNADLSTRVAALEASASAAAELHADRVRQLLSQIEAGTSDRVAELELAVEGERERAASALRQVEDDRRTFKTIGDRLFRHFRSAHGLAYERAVEAMLEIYGDDTGRVFVADDVVAANKGLSPEQIRTLQRTRGTARSRQGVPA